MKNGKHTKPRYTAARSFKRSRGYIAILDILPTRRPEGKGFAAQGKGFAVESRERIFRFCQQVISKFRGRVDGADQRLGAGIREASGRNTVINRLRQKEEAARKERAEDYRKSKELEEEMNKTHRNFGDMIKEATKKKPRLHGVNVIDGLPHS